ncbi:MAG: A/G-specific adenine glycosylase, partial [Myroides sp.]
MNFTNQLLNWYKKHKRSLPWRTTVNPYYIWLSEIILQQTRIEQGLPYYEAFTTKFPTLKDLATADEDA